jgi:hypothetical protein
MTPQTIKNYIRDDLGSAIGNYTTPQGQVYPAIRISPPEVPPDWKVSEGVEVIVFKSPRQLGQIQPTTGGGSFKQRNWVVRLTQFDQSESIQPAVDQIQTIFAVSESRVTRQSTTNYEQAVIEIKDPTFIGMGFDFTGNTTWDDYPYTPTYSTSAPLTTTVSYTDLTSDPNKGFASNAIANQWLRADLGMVHDVNRITVAGGNLPGYGNTAARLNGARIETSSDGIGWVHVGTVSGVSDTNGKQTFTLPQTSYCRYVRLYQPGAGLALVGLWINA